MFPFTTTQVGVTLFLTTDSFQEMDPFGIFAEPRGARFRRFAASVRLSEKRRTPRPSQGCGCRATWRARCTSPGAFRHLRMPGGPSKTWVFPPEVVPTPPFPVFLFSFFSVLLKDKVPQPQWHRLFSSPQRRGVPKNGEV